MSQTFTYTLLGTGSSGGVPRVGNQWGNCNPANPKNLRRRCALLVQKRVTAGAPTTMLVDAGADLRQQLLSASVTSLDGVLITHPHADHIFGLDDLRQLAMFLKKDIKVHMDQSTSDIVMRSFGYCFHQAPGSSYPAFCTESRIHTGQASVVDGPGGEISAVPVQAEHGDIHALGFRMGNLAYLPDIKRLAHADDWPLLENLSVLVVDALRYKSHPSHMNLEESLAFIEQVRPQTAILTNMHSDLDYDTLRDSLPPGVEPGFDGMTITIDASTVSIPNQQYAGESHG